MAERKKAIEQLQKFIEKEKEKECTRTMKPKVVAVTTTQNKEYVAHIESLELSHGLRAEGSGSTREEAKLNAARALKDKILRQQMEQDTGALDKVHTFTKEDKKKKEVHHPIVAIKTLTSTKTEYSVLMESQGLKAEGCGSTREEAKINAARALKDLRQQVQGPSCSKAEGE